jgi:hypothetical protein
VNWDEKEKQVWLGVLLEQLDIDRLNVAVRLRGAVTKAFKEVYRYEGGFTFSEDIPF